jgi:hypothetical protein
MMTFRWITKYSLLALIAGCQSYGAISVNTFKIDRNNLASTHVGTPDPEKTCPPTGVNVVVEWWVPHALLSCDPKVRLTLNYRNMTAEVIEYPIRYRIGYFSHKVVGKPFKESKGLLSYKAEVVTEDGEVFKKAVHQLFVNLIQLDSEGTSDDKIISSVDW